ncbi:MAG: single-stranded DNA-binding protein [Ruminococcus sp.]|nr:single-stranded DNA-binding protein [Ruminococcus sp.]
MARENTVYLMGRISKPTISIIEELGTYKLGFVINIFRANGRKDHIKVLVYGLTEERARTAWAKMKDNCWVIVRGMVATRLKKKTVVCPKCGLEKEVNILITEVISYDVPVVLNGDYNVEDLYEICNNVSVFGYVCTDVKLNTEGKSLMYQIKIDRRFNVEEQGDTRADYPWIKTFGKQAQLDRQHISRSSGVFVNGVLQTRELIRHYVCLGEGCDGVIDYKDTVAEILSRNTEYFTDCNFWLGDDK